MNKVRREWLKFLSKRFGKRLARGRVGSLNPTIPLLFGLGADHLARGDMPWTIKFMQRVLDRKPGTIVDIGANVGQYLLWLKSISADADYIGFEPSPDCYYYLNELIRVNAFTNCKVFPFALSNARQARVFYARRPGDKMGSFFDSNRPQQDKPRSFELLTAKGDELLGALGLKRVSFIKIDVEGAEFEVLRGLEKTLVEHRPVMLCEIVAVAEGHPGFEEKTALLTETFQFLMRHGYRVLSRGPADQLEQLRSPADFVPGQAIDRILLHADAHRSII